jgi:predicted acylesterase/phospholipase RssA
VPLPSIESVLERELAQVEKSRELRLSNDQRRTPTNQSLIGLAFSGGGIRSATFNLGVLQALAKARLLRTVDYVSTVSGGGYIGSWLMGWMHHQEIGIKKVEELLSAHPDSPAGVVERPEVRFLRNYSNYLTPRKGLLSADFWAFVASYLRNTILNQLILILLLLSLLLIPRSIVAALHFLELAELSLQQNYFGPLKDYMYAQYLALAVGLLLGFVALVFMGLNLVALDPGENKKYSWFTQQSWVQILIVVPLFLGGALLTYGLAHFLTDYSILDHPYSRLPLLGTCLYAGPWALALAVRTLVWTKHGKRSVAGPTVWTILITAAVTGTLISFLFLPYSRVLFSTHEVPGEPRIFTNWHVLTFGTPVFLGIMLLAGVLHIGLMGRQMSDAHREWWARLGGWLAIYSICWFFLFLMALYTPFAVGKFLAYFHSPTSKVTATVTSALAWASSTLYGVLFGKSGDTSGSARSGSTSKKFFTYLARVAPYVFIVGLLIGFSLVDAKIAHELVGMVGTILVLPKDAAFYPWEVPALCPLLLLGALILSWRVDVNEFSIHYLYRNRLVRCYLGASVEDRKAQPFTGFSDMDDVPLADLQIPAIPREGIDDRPLPILNATLNVVRGKELALQTRKARSFPFTPLFAGFTRPNPGNVTPQSLFAPTSELGADRTDSKRGVRLGTAMAISGAAVSPNMGSYSAADLAFLMTLFDVRLGWWLANPRASRARWRKGSPNLGFYWLLSELLGATNDDSDYLYLSDGGHFENLAIYELVRRRCRLIIACDASCDPGTSCGDLHNAMERCRVDFGVEIEINADEIGRITPVGTPPRAPTHYAVGSIHYNPDDPNEDGVLIYLKPALRGADAADLLGYALCNSEFPNDSTTDQWFDESHFENYRALGEVSAGVAVGNIQREVARLLSPEGSQAPPQPEHE